MRTCQYCRTENRADATYCNHCGALLDGSAPHATPSASASAAASAPPGYATRVTNATGRLPPQSTLHNRYLILKNAGQGGMAAVYKATDLRSNATVAIKEMSQDGLSPDDLREALESFTFEAKTLKSLHHANLPRVYDSFSENARHYLVMDFIDGQTLEQRQQATGGASLPEGEVLGWARQICAVLAYLHRQRPPIIFRDLKPANIMVMQNGVIKLIDFGIARVFAPGRSHDTQVLGTPGFAPPEQYGKAQTDPRADIYALGCTLYQLLTGYDPATTPFNLPPMRTRNPNTSAEVVRAIERATKLDREARYATMDDFARDLLAAPTATRPQGDPRTTVQHPVVGNSTATGTHTAASAARAAPTMAAIVVVQPHAVDFGSLVAGQRGTLSITIGGQGNAPVHGRITSLSPWLGLDRERFDGPSTIVQVTAQTDKLAQAGRQKSTLQIICDHQQLFVPVSLEVLPAPQKQPTQNQAKAKAPKAKAKAAKVRRPAKRRSRGERFLTSLACAGVVSGVVELGLYLLVQGRVPHVPHVTLIAPLAFALLLATTLLAVLAAFVGSGRPNWPGRWRTTLFGALSALALVLWAGVGWQWVGIQTLLHQAATIPLGLLIWTPLATSFGAAIGADPEFSIWMQAIAAFVARYARAFISIGGVLVGGWGGYVLAQSVGGRLASCLVPLGVVGGVMLGVAVSRVINSMLRPLPRSPRIPRMRPPSRYYP
jgi:serine/threonine protein kinase